MFLDALNLSLFRLARCDFRDIYYTLIYHWWHTVFPWPRVSLKTGWSRWSREKLFLETQKGGDSWEELPADVSKTEFMTIFLPFLWYSNGHKTALMVSNVEQAQIRQQTPKSGEFNFWNGPSGWTWTGQWAFVFVLSNSRRSILDLGFLSSNDHWGIHSRGNLIDHISFENERRPDAKYCWLWYLEPENERIARMLVHLMDTLWQFTINSETWN